MLQEAVDALFDNGRHGRHAGSTIGRSSYSVCSRENKAVSDQTFWANALIIQEDP